MATVSSRAWNSYLQKLRKLSDTAANKMQLKIAELGTETPEAMQALIEYAYALATKYGEGSAALACEMYDALAKVSGAIVPDAIPAATATYGETAKAIYGTAAQSSNPQVMSDAVGRLVKMAGVDTMQQNALRDGAEWAWIPSGDTCSFCLTLASRGWQKASKKAIRGGHAEHVHANCDCTYAIRLNSNVNVAGYDPDKYLDMYREAEGRTPQDKINNMRRQQYAEHRDEINEQHRIAYAMREVDNNN